MTATVVMTSAALIKKKSGGAGCPSWHPPFSVRPCPQQMVGKRVPLPSLSGVTRRVHAASVRRLGMLLPCGLPEGKAVSLLHWGTTSLLASVYATAIVRLRQS